MNRHLKEIQLVVLAFEESSRENQNVEDWRRHLQSCAKCRDSIEILRQAVSELSKRPLDEPSPFVWTQIKARVENSCTGEDWSEPSWISMIAWHFGGMAIMITLILLLGSWLESIPAWYPFLTKFSPGHFHPYGLAIFLVFAAGTLLTLAITPVLWWESNRTCPLYPGENHSRA